MLVQQKEREDNREEEEKGKRKVIIRHKRLGRGLAALLGDMNAGEQTAFENREVVRIPINSLLPGPTNPRKTFEKGEIDELSHSIQQKGLLQPVLARPVGPSGQYEIIAGERRWRAAKQAGLCDIPVILRHCDEKEALELAIVENVQRSNLNPLEEASGYERLLSEFGYTQNALAKIVGKSRSHIANTVRLLKLPLAVQEHLRSGVLTAGHARTLIGSENPERQAGLLIRRGMNVRQAESNVRRNRRETSSPSEVGYVEGGTEREQETLLERKLSDALGVPVSVMGRGGGKGILRISYQDMNQLAWICKRLQPSSGCA